MFGPPDVKKLAAKGKVEPLVRALTHPYESIQRDAATALGELRDPRAIEPLAAASRDDRLAVRDAAVWALGHIGDPAVIPTLLTHLREGNDRAACALTAIGRPAVGPLLDSSPQTPRARWASRSRRWARSATHGRPPRSRRSWAPPRPGPHGPTTRSCRWVSPPSSTCSRCCGLPCPRTWECAYDADHPSGGDARYKRLSFEGQRQMAQRQLARRGNPAHDVSAYAALTSG